MLPFTTVVILIEIVFDEFIEMEKELHPTDVINMGFWKYGCVDKS